MPNHVTTVCTVTGPAETIDAFAAAHFVPGDGKPDPIFDFKTIIPQPEIVSKTESGTEAEQGFFALTGLHKVTFATFGENPLQLAIRHGQMPDAHRLTTVDDYRAWLEAKNPGAIEKGRIQLQCFRETGHMNWYDWNIAEWGTKWGAYDYEPRFREPNKLVFKFETAWSFPQPIFEELNERYPSLVFDVVAIDEGGPEYEGHYSADESRFAKAEPSDERYKLVYGREREADEDDEEEGEE